MTSPPLNMQRFAFTCLFVLGACDRGQESPSPSADSAGPSRTVTPAPVVSAPVTELGIGPLRVGMTVDEARAALGTFEVPTTALKSGCDYASSPSLPPGVTVMVEDGIVGRIDVKTKSVPTSEGARVGDTEERVRQLYGPRASVSPHKYTDGHYLTVKSATADTTHFIIFETNEDTVTMYRAGRLPQVRYVEGCS